MQSDHIVFLDSVTKSNKLIHMEDGSFTLNKLLGSWSNAKVYSALQSATKVKC